MTLGRKFEKRNMIILFWKIAPLFRHWTISFHTLDYWFTLFLSGAILSVKNCFGQTRIVGFLNKFFVKYSLTLEGKTIFLIFYLFNFSAVCLLLHKLLFQKSFFWHGKKNLQSPVRQCWKNAILNCLQFVTRSDILSWCSIEYD